MNFDLAEYVRSETAARLKIDNSPPQSAIDNLKLWHVNIREPLELKLGIQLQITSGYRCLALNRAIGSSDNSQHITGNAADFVAHGYSPMDLYEFIIQKTSLPFDQLICEYPKKNGWVHASFKANPRHQYFIID